MNLYDFLELLKAHGYTVKGILMHGRDLMYRGEYVGFLSYDRDENPRGFVVKDQAVHLRTLCVLHDQKVIV